MKLGYIIGIIIIVIIVGFVIIYGSVKNLPETDYSGKQPELKKRNLLKTYR